MYIVLHFFNSHRNPHYRSAQMHSHLISPSSCQYSRSLSRSVNSQSLDEWVDVGEVEGSDVWVLASESDEHGAVDNWVTFVDIAGRLVSETLVVTSDGQLSVGSVQLASPKDPLGCSVLGDGADVGNVRVVGADSLARQVPSKVDLLTREAQRLRSVTGDGRTTAVASDVQVDAALVLRDVGDGRVGSAVANALVVGGIVGGPAVGVRLVHDVKSWEVLPRDTGVVLGARRDVRSEESPGPGLGDTGLEPDRHRRESKQLSEDHLLSGLRVDTLLKESRNLTRIEVGVEAKHARLAEPGKDLVEVDELAGSGVWVVVSALLGGSLAEHVGEEGGVASLLLGHEANDVDSLSAEAYRSEILVRESRETVVEAVKLDPLLVKGKHDRLVVKVRLDHVPRGSTVGTKTTSGLVWNRLGLLELAVGIVVGSSWSRAKVGDGLHHGVGGDGTGSGGNTIVGAVGGEASGVAGDARGTWVGWCLGLNSADDRVRTEGGRQVGQRLRGV